MAKDTKKMNLALGRPIAPKNNAAFGRTIGTGTDTLQPDTTGTDTLEPDTMEPPYLRHRDDAAPVSNLQPPANTLQPPNTTLQPPDLNNSDTDMASIGPKVGATSTQPAPVLGPAGQRLQSALATPPPEYHGFKRFADTLAGTTRIGQAIEEAGHLGTFGHKADIANAADEANLEAGQQKQIEASSKSAADIGKTTAETGEAEARGEAVKQGMEDVAVYNPLSQEWIKIPRKDYAGFQKTIATQTGAGQRAENAQEGQDMRAAAGNLSRETVADGKTKYADVQTPDGKKVPGKEDAHGNLLMADGTPAPQGSTKWHAPTYAEIMGGRLTTIMVDGIPTNVQLTPQGVKVIGKSGTGTFAGRAGQAKIIQSAGDSLIKDIQANRDKLGDMSAIVSAAILGTPWADPETQQLYAEIGSYIALHPAMHGFRGTNALEHFSNLIGGIPNNPDALVAGIQGLGKMAGYFLQQGETAPGSIVPGTEPRGTAPHGAPNPSKEPVEEYERDPVTHKLVKKNGQH